MANELNALFEEIAELKRRMSATSFQGSVHEVKGDKMRVNLGKDPDGKPVLSPWLDTSDHRGGARERRLYTKGQNVTVATVNGDMNEAATISADAPNKACKAPDHADEAGDGAETYQLGEMHTTKKKDTYEMFLQEEKKDDQKSGGQQGGGQQGDDKQKPNAKFRFHKDGGITGRVGEARFAAHKDGVKMRVGDQFITVTKDGIFSSKPIVIGKDSIPNDDS